MSTPVGDAERDDDLLQDFKSPVFELGGDVTQTAGRRRDQAGWPRHTPHSATGWSATVFAPKAAIRYSAASSSSRMPSVTRRSCASTGRGSNLAGFSFEAGSEGVAQHARPSGPAVRVPGGRRSQSRSTFRSTRPRSRKSAPKPSFASEGKCPLRSGSMPASTTNIRRSAFAATPTLTGTTPILEAQPDARLEGRQGLARPAVGPAHRRPARLLRLHQLSRTVGRSHQCRQSRPGAAADLGVPRHDRASALR